MEKEYEYLIARVAQLVRALVLWAEGRGFDPRLEHFLYFILVYVFNKSLIDIEIYECTFNK